MAAGIYDFTIEQGATHVTTFVWKTQPGQCCGDDDELPPPTPVDITNYSIAMQVRPSAGSAVLYFEATSANSMLSQVTPEEGVFALHVPAEVSADWEWKRGVYDIKFTELTTGVVTRLLKGAITVSLEVTVAVVAVLAA